MAASSAQVLAPSAGWAVVIALGIGFAFVMVGISYIQERYTAYSVKTQEEFSSASRSVQAGLIASSIVSAWTWAATLLQSSAEAFKLGISGPYWYAAGATVQILLFSMMASKTKLNAPFAHTYLQIIRERWGTVLHVVHLFFGLATNVLVGAMLILGGSATVNQLTGMPTLAAVFLTPISVAIYTLVGGLRSTFLADYAHTAALVAIILMFAIYTYAVSDKIGSPQEMFRLLETAAPVEGNAGGSYVTMRSISGLCFGIINLAGNLATVFCDQAYHQRGIASSPEVATKGFILGGIAWFAVPMLTASSLGLAARALYGKDPAMAMLSAAEISAGLPAPAAAAALLGKGGAAAMLVLLYLAVTSATSAQLIAVSSVLTYDVYRTYIHPSASPSRLFWLSHIMVAVWAIVMGILGLIFYYASISMGYLYLVLGIIVCPAVFPVFSCLVWSKANRWGALTGMVAGLPIGIMSWLVSAYKLEGAVTLDTTSSNYPLVVGNVISLCLPALITIVWSLISPENYSFEGTRAINAPEHVLSTNGDASSASRNESKEKEVVEKDDSSSSDDEKKATSLENGQTIGVSGHTEPHDEYQLVRAAGLNPEQLLKSYRLAFNVSLPLTFILVIFIPCMAIIAKTFSPAGLGAWVGIIIAHMFGSAFIVIFLPVWESRVALGQIITGMLADLTGKRRRQVAAA